MARLSLRSFVAVGTFLCVAMAVGTLGYYKSLGFLSDEKLNPQTNINNYVTSAIFLAVGLLLPIVGYFMRDQSVYDSFGSYVKEHIIVYLVGVIFGLGLMISGMTRRIKIMRFLQIGNDWDPSLLFVLGAGVLVNVIVFQYMIRVQ